MTFWPQSTGQNFYSRKDGTSGPTRPSLRVSALTSIGRVLASFGNRRPQWASAPA
ncbi:hypothetical protein B0F90DRAFT_1745962, partial [Multifurca ochricompacta]